MQQRLQSIRGNQHKPARDGVSGMTKRQRFAASENLAAVETAHAGDAIEQFLLTLALQSRDAENFAPPQTERDVVDPMAAAQAAHFERRDPVRRYERRAGRGGVSRPGVGRRLAEHQRDDPLLASGRDIGHADDDPVAKHRRPVAERRDLGHSMRNEDYRMPALAPVADNLEYALGQIRGQGGGNFVEQEYEGIGSERSRQVDQAQNRIRKVTNEGVEAKVLDPERLEPPPHRARSHVGQPHVVGDGQIGNQGRVLIDRNDARGSRLGGRAKRSLGVADRDRSPVRGKDAGQNLHQRALSRAVRAHQSVDFPGAHAEGRRAKCDDRAEPLGDVAGFEEVCGAVHDDVVSRPT